MTENPILEAALENVEAIVDTLTANGLVREIPVVGTAVKLLHAYYHGRRFLGKAGRKTSAENS